MSKKIKNIFFVNPVAGNQKYKEKFIETIQSFADSGTHDIMVYKTLKDRKTVEIIDEICENSQPEYTYRFFACGGDGTLNEIIEGAIKYENAEIGVFPMGTGNDFVRSFDVDFKNFSDVSMQMSAEPVEVDLVEITRDSYDRKEYFVNMLNIGFDANVVRKTHDIKKNKWIPNKMAYLLGVAKMLVSMKGAEIEVTVDNKVIHRGTVLLTAVGNGACCGGGIKCLPTADLNDGLMDVGIILPVSRLKFIKLFSKYAKGTHVDIGFRDGFLKYVQGEKCTIEALDGNFIFCIDGEEDYCKKITCSISKKKLKFLIPK